MLRFKAMEIARTVPLPVLSWDSPHLEWKYFTKYHFRFFTQKIL